MYIAYTLVIAFVVVIEMDDEEAEIREISR